MRVLIFVAALTAALTSPALTTPPAADERSGRFTMQPVDGGYLRLDTATGDVWLCTRAAENFECRPAKDDRDLRSEITRLSTENKDLKAEIKRLEEMLSADANAPRPTPKLELPKEEDVDKALDYLERMFKKFRDRMKELDKPLEPDPKGGKGTPL